MKSLGELRKHREPGTSISINKHVLRRFQFIKMLHQLLMKLFLFQKLRLRTERLQHIHINSLFPCRCREFINLLFFIGKIRDQNKGVLINKYILFKAFFTSFFVMNRHSNLVISGFRIGMHHFLPLFTVSVAQQPFVSQVFTAERKWKFRSIKNNTFFNRGMGGSQRNRKLKSACRRREQKDGEKESKEA